MAMFRFGDIDELEGRLFILDSNSNYGYGYTHKKLNI